MSTPRSKPLIRYNMPRLLKRRKIKAPDGTYHSGISNPKIAQLFGFFISSFPHVEECMINIMALLLGGRNAPARQVFRSLNSEDARVRVMRSLLEQASINKDKGKEFDEIIDIFVEIKKKRNAYAHGLWSTHDSGRVFLQETSTDPINSFMSEREVKTGELNAALNRVRELFKKSMPILYPEYFGPDGKFRPSRQMPPPLPIVENQ